MFHIEKVIFQFANEDELPIVIRLLKDSHLPYEDLTHRSLQNFLLAKFETLTIGCIGIEVYNETALLRSFCIEESFRRLGIGKLMYQKMENFVKRKV